MALSISPIPGPSSEISIIRASGVIAKLVRDLGRVGNRETPGILTVLVLEDLVMAVYLPVVAVLLAGCATSTAGQLDAMLAGYDDHPVQVAVLVVDLDSGETVLARDRERLFRPASTMKLLTTAAICRRELLVEIEGVASLAKEIGS